MTHRRLVFLILFIMMLAQLATDLYLPSLPAIANELGAHISTVQLTFSLFMAGFAVSQFFYGPLSDYLGRKSVLTTGVVIYFAMSIIAALLI